MSNNKLLNLEPIKKFLDLMVLFAIVGEFVFFPSWENSAGCLMFFLVYCVFRLFFLRSSIILYHPFSFLAYVTLFLACFIPLPATLLEGKEISYGFEVPLQTFFWETVLFFIASLAFYLNVNKVNSGSIFLKRFLYLNNFFNVTESALWKMGILGVSIRIWLIYISGSVEFGDVNNKFLYGLIYLQYAPILILFPALVKFRTKRSKYVWFYLSFIIILSLASNSREALINPLIMLVVLFFISFILCYNTFKLSVVRVLSLILISIVLLNFLSDVSLAILANRSFRSQIGRLELFNKTIDTLSDEQYMNKLRKSSLEERNRINSYNLGWDENYLNNFMLNRYGNMRITDQTLYYANKVGFDNDKMKEIFYLKSIALIPLPILNFFGFKLNKNDLLYSQGDLLYSIGGNSSSLGTYRVTSLISDTLVTFGYFGLFFLFLALYILFYLLESFVILINNQPHYSIFSLVSVFLFIGMLRHSNGLFTITSYLFRGFWEGCFTYWLITFIFRKFSMLKSNKNL